MTADLPKVPRQHEVARAAVRWVEGKLPASWVIHKPAEGDDYGVDARVEISEGAALTGRQVVLQIKGTSDPSELDRVRVARHTINYLSRLADPAVILRVCPSHNRVRMIALDDARFADESVESVSLDEADEVDAAKLGEMINRLSCRRLIQKGQAPVVVALESEVAVRRTALLYEGRLRGVVIFETSSDSPWQQYSSVYSTESNSVHLTNLLPPFQEVELPMEASFSELITGNVVFMWAIGLGLPAARMLLNAATLIGNKLVHVEVLIRCAAENLSGDECTRIIKIGIANGVSWPARWMLTLIRAGVRLDLTTQDVETAFELQRQHHSFPLLPVVKAQVLLALGDDDAALIAAEEAKKTGLRTQVFYFELSDVFARCGEVEKCIQLLEDALKASPNSPVIALELSKYQLLLDRYETAYLTLRTFETPKFDPLRSLYRLCEWIAWCAPVALARESSDSLLLAWKSARAALATRNDPDTWVECVVRLELIAARSEQSLSNAALFYSSLFFGGDIARWILEHPFAQTLSPVAIENLSSLAEILDAYRNGAVALAAEENGDLVIMRADGSA